MLVGTKHARETQERFQLADLKEHQTARAFAWHGYLLVIAGRPALAAYLAEVARDVAAGRIAPDSGEAADAFTEAWKRHGSS